MSTRDNPGWMSERERKRRKLPKHCECGGRMLYEADFDRVFSVCDTCTPVVEIDVSTLPGLTNLSPRTSPYVGDCENVLK